jgi:tetratricopeptide (TPR) repeat protein
MRLFLLVIGLSFFSCQKSIAQKKLDSLLNVLKNYPKEDTTKAMLMYEVGTMSVYSNPKRTYSLANELTILGEQLKYANAISCGMLLKGIYFMTSLQLDSATYMYNKVKAYGESIHSEYTVAIVNGNLASVALMNGKQQEAIQLLKESIAILDKEKKDEPKGKFMVNLANAYNLAGERVLALKTALQALDVISKFNDANAIAAANYLIGTLYGTSSQFKEALQYHQGYANMQMQLGNWSNVCTGLLAAGNDYAQLNKKDSAVIILDSALKLAKKHQLTFVQNKISLSISTLKAQKNNELEELDKLLELKAYYTKNGLQNELGYVLCKIGIAYAQASDEVLKREKLDNASREKLALSYIHEALDFAVQSNNYPLKEEATRAISLYYEIQKDYPKAYAAYQKYILLRDSAINESQQVEISKLNLQYNFKRKEDSLKLIQVNTDAALQQQAFLNQTQAQNILLQNNQLLLNKQTLFANQQKITILNKDKELEHLAFLKTEAELQTEQLQKNEKQQQLNLVTNEKMLQTASLKTLSQENELNKLKQRQLLFYSIATLATLLFVGLYFFNSNKAKQAQLKLALEKQEAEFQRSLVDVSMSALRSQMNPHFIFNCLNSIKSYITQNDTVAAANYLTKFSKLIRIALDNSRTQTVTLDAELKSLDLYLLMEGMRFKEKLQYSITVDEEIEKDLIQIPPMLLQPYIENSIWHGLMHKEAGGRIDIHFDLVTNEQTLLITIKDNGVGRASAAALKSQTESTHKSFGTKVTSERLDMINQIFKTGASVHTEDMLENGSVAGTLVTIKIPFA